VSEESDLEKAHAQLVEQRRLIIKSLATGKAIGTDVEMLLKIQSGIDVLDVLDEDEDEEDEE
jgi:plasmid maintenance system antidote protein VapI